MDRRRLLSLLGLTLCWCARAGTILNGINDSAFRVTTFATGLPFAQAMQTLPDGSLLIQTSPGYTSGQLLRFVDANHDGIADGPGTSVYSSTAGPFTGLVQAGSYYLQGNQGTHTIEILKPGALSADPMTAVGSLNFSFTAGWWHDTVGMAVRPTPGAMGSFDLVFNVGSQSDAVHGTDTVGLSGGLISANLQQESFYMVTLNLTGATPVASNLRQVASGIRNSFGLAFDPATGDLLFGDNAIDGSPTPPQADELNRISAANLGTIVPNFGFPTCYPDYTTGLLVGSGCVAPLAAFIPTVQGRRQGAANIALAPSSFPAGYNNGVFVGFAGQFFGAGVIYNPVTYYDFGTGKYTDVILEGTLGRPIGLLSTADSLFISDFSTGSVFQITSAAPEPGSGVPIGLALCALALRQRTRSRCRTAGPTPATP